MRVCTKQHQHPHPPTHTHTHTPTPTPTHPHTHTHKHLKGVQKTGSRHQRHCFALADPPLIPPSPSPSICPPPPPYTHTQMEEHYRMPQCLLGCLPAFRESARPEAEERARAPRKRARAEGSRHARDSMLLYPIELGFRV